MAAAAGVGPPPLTGSSSGEASGLTKYLGEASLEWQASAEPMTAPAAAAATADAAGPQDEAGNDASAALLLLTSKRPRV